MWRIMAKMSRWVRSIDDRQPVRILRRYLIEQSSRCSRQGLSSHT